MNSNRGRGGAMPSRNYQPQQQPNQQPPMEYGNNQVDDVIDKPLGQEQEYNPSSTSHGSGFFGATPLTDTTNEEPLPDDALDVVQSIQDYLEGITLDEEMMNRLSITQRNSMKGQQAKLLKDLNNQIGNKTMSHYVFTYLTEIFDLLQNQEYEKGLRHITDFTRSCNSKKIKFATHRKWVMAFQSIIRIAK